MLLWFVLVLFHCQVVNIYIKQAWFKLRGFKNIYPYMDAWVLVNVKCCVKYLSLCIVLCMFKIILKKHRGIRVNRKSQSRRARVH